MTETEIRRRIEEIDGLLAARANTAASVFASSKAASERIDFANRRRAALIAERRDLFSRLPPTGALAGSLTINGCLGDLPQSFDLEEGDDEGPNFSDYSPWDRFAAEMGGDYDI